jgi:hypothetical protein
MYAENHPYKFILCILATRILPIFLRHAGKSTVYFPQNDIYFFFPYPTIIFTFYIKHTLKFKYTPHGIKDNVLRATP